MTYAKSAKVGAELLDERVPGWVNRISVDHLKMASAKDCVLGQLFGRFSAGLDWLGTGSANFLLRHGFALMRNPEDGPALTNAWQKEIAVRKNRGAA